MTNLILIFFYRSLLCLSVLIFGCTNRDLTSPAWNIRSLYPGVTHKYIYDAQYLGERRTINILEVDLSNNEFELDIAINREKLQKTSKMAEEAGAIIAINGSFFDPEKGGAVCYLKKEGDLINLSKPDPEELLFLEMLDEGALVIDENGEFSIQEKPKLNWESLKAYHTILSSGPLLLKDGIILEQEDIPFMKDSHARSSVGTSRGKLFFVAVDGYREQAVGVSMNDLAVLMQTLGCMDALNLDGGGSTTLWSKYSISKILNFPSDNKLLDHEGERAVANAILVIPKK